MKNDYIVFGILGVAAVILLYSVFWLFNDGNPNVTLKDNQNAGSFKTISTGSTEPGDVSVDLTPRGIVNGQFQVDFEINTHSVDLSPYDLEKIMTLEYDSKKINPMNAPKLEGHHSSGVLTFNVAEDLDDFKITIKGIPQVEERIFEWNFG